MHKLKVKNVVRVGLYANSCINSQEHNAIWMSWRLVENMYRMFQIHNFCARSQVESSAQPHAGHLTCLDLEPPNLLESRAT